MIARLIVVLLSSVIVTGCLEAGTGINPRAWDFYQDYQKLPHYRALAATPGSRNDAFAIGYGKGAAGAQAAVSKAMASCNKARAEYEVTVECRLHSVGDIKVFNMSPEEREAAIALYDSNVNATEATLSQSAVSQPGKQELPYLWYQDIEGTYEGKLISGDKPYSVVTTFFSDENGAIQGNYAYNENNEKTTGRLYDFVPSRTGKIQFSWQDKYGTGKLIVSFSHEFKQFSGNWGIGQSINRANYWNGTLLSGTGDSGAENASRARAQPESSSPEKFATGTGFIVTKSGRVLTNQHVVDGCRELRTPPNTKLQIVAEEKQNDLALLQMPVGFKATATFGQGQGVRPGDDVVTAGFPLQGLLTSDLIISTGIVSALAGPGNDRRLLQITAPIQPGNSGGPLFDSSGNVVGVIVGKIDALKVAGVTGTIPENVNFAIGSWTVRSFMDAYNIPYETLPNNRKFTTRQVADRAREITILIECWK